MLCDETSYKGAPGYTLEDGDLSVTVLKRGAKLQSIRFCGRELLWQSPGTEYRYSEYGDLFETGEFSGFDDMFPNISACPYPDGVWRGTELPDHGEVWTQEWDCAPDGDGVTFAVHGVKLPYSLEKRVSLYDGAVRLDYRAENLSRCPMKYIWAAHPLFILEEGMRLEIPGCTRIMNVCGDPNALGAYGERHTWPLCSSGRDLSVLSRLNRSFNKYYVWDELAENRSSLVYPDGLRVTLNAPAGSVPYLGVWTDEGGYGDYGMYCAAPEPCTGAFDRLDIADLFGRVSVLDGYEYAGWSLTVNIDYEE